jgi:hypothetical protein
MRTRQTARDTQKKPGTVTKETPTDHTARNGREKKRDEKAPSEKSAAEQAQREKRLSYRHVQDRLQVGRRNKN